jgi:16S rRNA (uracil1498-N3)-methyltransferase
MPRIFISNSSVQERQISITGEKARYLISVLKCGKGDELSIFDGRGNCFRTNILRTDKKEVVIEVLETFPCNTESPVNIILIQGLLKGQKMDLIIQKATELGVREIQPVITGRSQTRETRKVGRWQKIAEEASRQSGRSVVPLIHEPIHFDDYLSSLATRHSQLPLRGFIFWEEGGISFKEAAHKMSLSPVHLFTDLPVHILIGPEGGFTKNETALAESNGFIITSLGKRILRAETAAISAMTLVQFLLGDLG